MPLNLDLVLENGFYFLFCHVGIGEGIKKNVDFAYYYF